ncbi:bifunctional phosphopantothenoylcysteine decarboxylase/phosphopantothenate--cysteine ligase CoaBC [bacterium]|nr:bifunctional phosphopantothenoylcysteine decarboxylase/phosphopantothenate--cysteine ligase CoaBC [bacterium]NIN92352.1 bifunctional phosphopantothenoylcysteine decarboxylase/phosphopantothenate--cysteine ligase CoaBC [bacterium]NIO18466.1 bifunctional phosphopantothenoylcysteine decarboxylase/phosphopantothenate--cysteine ligase CoaBC [bacterium]NIO73462.1 bifunctional phosphopantothenoylcysteine decarboxylase/phosphopantothenate--cysteine ligase CoaBC [bacterium]
MKKNRPFADRKIILGITGSIAAYKACEIVSRLKGLGAEVFVIMTRSATHFVTPLTFQTLSGNRVYLNLFDLPEEWEAEHISLAERADLILVAPATANTIAKLAAGIADNLLTTTVLASEAPVVIAPAMHETMYKNRFTQANIEKLKEKGFKFIGPEYGRLASGKSGLGRLASIDKIMDALRDFLARDRDMAGRTFLITAGPTREYLDPVRYISNASSGKMGYVLAEVAQRRGAKVILISGPTNITPPQGVNTVFVDSAQDMEKEVVKYVPRSDVVIASAAVSDYRPKKREKEKIKTNFQRKSINLVRNPDILGQLGKQRDAKCLIGFALETKDLEKNAREKLKRKNLDMIIANTPEAMSQNEATVKIFTKSGKKILLREMKKEKIAERILSELKEFMK